MNNKNKLTLLIVLGLLIGLGSYALYNAFDSKPIPDLASPKPAIEATKGIVELAPPPLSNDTLKRFPVIQTIIDTTNVNDLQTLLSNFLSSLDEEQLAEVAYFFSQSDIESPRFNAINVSVIEYWTKKSAINALSFSLTQFHKDLKSQAVDRVLVTKCTNQEDIKSCITDLPYNQEIETRLLTISQQALNQNKFPKALIWADAIQNAERKASLIDQITKHWVINDPEEAFQWAVFRESFIETAKAAINQVIETDPWQAYSLVSQISDVNFSEIRAKMYTKIINTLVESGDYLTVMSILESAAQHDTIASIARKWIDTDPKAALEWALNQEGLHSLGLRAIDELTKKDHQQAFEITSLVTNDRSDLRKDMFISIFSDRANQEDYKSIMQMLDQLPRGELAENYYDIFITQWTESEPTLAIDAVLNLPSSETKGEFIINTLEAWSEKEPHEAIKKLNALNDSSEKASAITGVISGWAKNNSNDMLEWLSQQPSSPDLDNSIAQASKNLVTKQPDKGPTLELVNKISDDALRKETLEKVQSHVYSEPDYN